MNTSIPDNDLLVKTNYCEREDECCVALSPHDGATLQPFRTVDRQALWERCKQLASKPRILDCLSRELECQGVVGEQRAAMLIYLIVTSRLLPRPISGAVKGPSSAGKSHTANKVLSFFPRSAFSDLTGSSEKALIYDDEPLKHRTIVMAEAAGLVAGFGAYIMRSLLTEGRIKYKTVAIGPTGPEPKTIEREGPTNLLVTTTAIHLDSELETRLLSIPINDSQEQTSAVIRAQAARYTGAFSDAEPDLSEWHCFQEWLENGERRVVIPFADLLANMIPPVALRLRRDIPAILGLITTHAILHQASRKRDAQGRIVATLDDYAVVRELVTDLIAESAGAGVAISVRETVEAVRYLTQNIMGRSTDRYPSGVSCTGLAKWMKLDKSTVSRRVNRAIQLGYLRNEQPQKGCSAFILINEPLPEESDILPLVEALQCCSGAGGDGSSVSVH